jgi:lipoprotein NlpI
MARESMKNIRAMCAAAVMAIAAPVLSASPALAASETSRGHCQSSDVSLRLSGCTLIVEDKAEPASMRASAHLNRGLAFKAKGAYDRAIEDYDEAMGLRPDDPLAYIDRGVVLRLKGDIDNAIADFSEAIRLNPVYADTFYNRGEAYMAKGDAESALADFEEAIKRGSNARSATAGPGGIAEISAGQINADYFIGRGLANFALGKYAAAAADYAGALAQRAQQPYLALWLQVAQARSGGRGAGPEFQKALSKFKKGEWPRPLFELFEGEKTAEAVLGAASGADELCEAQYYVAQWRLARAEQQAEGLAGLRIVANTCRQNYTEHGAALGELRRLGQ